MIARRASKSQKAVKRQARRGNWQRGLREQSCWSRRRQRRCSPARARKEKGRAKGRERI